MRFPLNAQVRLDDEQQDRLFDQLPAMGFRLLQEVQSAMERLHTAHVIFQRWESGELVVRGPSAHVAGHDDYFGLNWERIGKDGHQ